MAPVHPIGAILNQRFPHAVPGEVSGFVVEDRPDGLVVVRWLACPESDLPEMRRYFLEQYVDLLRQHGVQASLVSDEGEPYVASEVPSTSRAPR